jgi:outer membrane biosynthesis protein TonB
MSFLSRLGLVGSLAAHGVVVAVWMYATGRPGASASIGAGAVTVSVIEAADRSAPAQSSLVAQPVAPTISSAAAMTNRPKRVALAATNTHAAPKTSVVAQIRPPSPTPSARREERDPVSQPGLAASQSDRPGSPPVGSPQVAAERIDPGALSALPPGFRSPRDPEVVTLAEPLSMVNPDTDWASVSSGMLRMSIGVQRTGQVSFLRYVASSGNAMLDAAFEAAVLSTAFSPCRLSTGDTADCMVNYRIEINVTRRGNGTASARFCLLRE